MSVRVKQHEGGGERREQRQGLQRRVEPCRRKAGVPVGFRKRGRKRAPILHKRAGIGEQETAYLVDQCGDDLTTIHDHLTVDEAFQNHKTLFVQLHCFRVRACVYGNVQHGQQKEHRPRGKFSTGAAHT